MPTPGPRTVRYGGNTSSIEVRLADGTVILLDGGTGLAEFGRSFGESASLPPFHLLITHVHWDHVIGVPFFAPLYRPEACLVFHPVGGSPTFGPDQLFDGRGFPLRLNEVPASIVRADVATHLDERTIGSARVRGIALNHPGGSTGYRIDDADGSSLVLYTDNELAPPGADVVLPRVERTALVEFARDTGLLIHDAQYLEVDLPRKRGRGHSLASAVLELGRDAGVRMLALYHHDPERDDDALDALAGRATHWWRDEVGAGAVLIAREGLSFEVLP